MFYHITSCKSCCYLQSNNVFHDLVNNSSIFLKETTFLLDDLETKPINIKWLGKTESILHEIVEDEDLSLKASKTGLPQVSSLV